MPDNRNEPQVWLAAAEVMARYRKGRSTLDRWISDPALNFPKPRYVRTKRLWHASELDAFDQRLLEQS
jgi:predicted DNA-binding transcriptional regulator AlpA